METLIRLNNNKEEDDSKRRKRRLISNKSTYLFQTSLVFLISFIFSSTVVQGQEPFRRFEYKYSFKPPYLAQRDGSVPFWEHSGNAIASEENLRITPSLKSQKGMIWSRLTTTFEWWEVEILFRVTGRGRIGADGLAFWFTDQKGVEGPVFGSSDQWNGLGVFFDTFDNDNKHNNPYIMAMVNDGTKLYDHQNDGSTQQLAGCLRDFRNKPFPVRTKVMYYKNVLSIFINNGMSNSDTDYELCLRAEGVVLPARGVFGLSAATGGLADDHDVQKFMTWSLILDQTNYGDGITAEQQKFDQEFKQYQDQLDKKKEEYHKEHPDAKKEKDDEDWFEEEQIRELRQIFQGQSELRGLVQGLSRKLDEIVGRQETTISLVSSFQHAGNAIQQGHVPLQGQIPMQPPIGGGGGGMQRHEVDNMLAASRELLTSTRDIKNLLQSLSTRQDQLNAKPGSYGNLDITGSVNELKDGINILKRDVSLVSQRVHQAPVAGAQIGGCPSCVSTTVVITMSFIQMGVILGYLLYKSSKESQAKKFY